MLREFISKLYHCGRSQDIKLVILIVHKGKNNLINEASKLVKNNYKFTECNDSVVYQKPKKSAVYPSQLTVTPAE